MAYHSDFFSGEDTKLIQTQLAEIAIKTLDYYQQTLAKRLKRGSQDRFWDKYYFVHPYLLELALESALIDLERMAKFHLPDSMPDNHKYAGYFSYWVAKVRPIQITKDINKIFPEAMAINAKFATEVMFAFIRPEHDLLANSAKILEYAFQYRDTPPQALAHIAYALERNDTPDASELPNLP